MVADIPIIEMAMSDDPLNLFYDPKQGCTLPWEVRPVNCHVYTCGLLSSVELAVFTQLVALPLKALRKFAWEYWHAPNDKHRDLVYSKARGNFREYPNRFGVMFERYMMICQNTRGFEKRMPRAEDGVEQHRARCIVHKE